MLGGAGLKGRGLPAMARQRLTAFPRSARSMSSFRPGTSTFPLRSGLTNQSLAGNLSWRSASAINRVSATRFNSTSSAAAATTGDQWGAPAEVAEFPELDVNSIPEKIGYLKDLGLDYGWGPSACIEYIIEHFHIWGGLPWWASIVGTGLLVRLALLKPMLNAADTSTKVSNLKEVIGPLRAAMTASAQGKDQVTAMKYKAQISQVQRDNGVNPYKTFIPFLQIPIGFGCYRVVKGMASLPVPGLATESVGWIQDLTIADPYMALPAATALFMYLSFKKGGESGMNQFQQTGMGQIMLYVMPSITFAFTAFFPSALQLYFASTGLFALGQAYLLSSHKFRRFANIAIPNPVDEVSMTPAEKQRALRMLTEAVRADTIASRPESSSQKISFIDRTINSIKQKASSTGNEMKEKLAEATGQGPKKNADGTLAEAPRLSEKDRKLADDYEQRRREEETWRREGRNHARRMAHMRTLEQEKEKARSAFKAKQR
ncbi:60Kd inner membrane protein-domain-containing protein [Aspergillus avenaceus]|uniref:60Kd inner membrane protein-domain-containing protein n=1 Tax=Aspergillus avenaceus TaxID=36643 RepID=A0A5N6TDZ8_ASPAV|nr:60Kd inner membrane protein-domain-containing protein [Aspergillus avenaceus]